MDLKKNKKLKKKYDSTRIERRRIVRMHVYRSEDKFAPFREWTRITDEPLPAGKFDDRTVEPGKRYFYKITKVDENGRESLPEDPARGYYLDEDGNRLPDDYDPLNAVVGYHIYRSTDPDLPLDQWERRNPELLPDTGFTDTGIEKGVTYYYYVTAVSAAGIEGERSKIVSAIQ